MPAMLLLLGCALHAIRTPEASFPLTDGELVVEGLEAPVTVYRDAYGVPHIRAESERDLWFTVGFVHAQDRLFQMDLVRRLGSGRMAAWFGPMATEFDAFMKSLELEDKVAKRISTADPELVAVGDAYAAGINAGAASLPALPVEYRVLGFEWEPWRRTDALATSVINSWILSENAPKELITLMLAEQLDADMATALWRWDPASPAVDRYWDELRSWDIGELDAPFRGVVEFLWGVHDPSASNNWAVSGERSADGSPILANDPHLLQMVPSVWHVYEGRGGDIHTAGATLAGTPFPASGHNEHVAWGVTNVMADYVDLAVVERVGETAYVRAGEEKDLRFVDVEVEVAGEQEPARRTIAWTEVGPVITKLEGTHLVALRWSMLEARDETPQMWFEIQRAESVHDVIEAATKPSILSQNLVSADTHGHISWQVFGSLPDRRGFSGRVPYPASDPAYGWDGFLDDLPGQLDPARGYVRTANAPPDDDPEPYRISTAFMPAWRHDRIAEVLEASVDHTPDTMARLQQDVYDPHAADQVPRFLGMLGEDVSPEAARCRDVLASWDFEATTDSEAMAVWAAFQEELLRIAVVDELGELGHRLYTAAAISGRSALDGEVERFLDDPATDVDTALANACRAMPAGTTWGEVHPLRVRHPFSDESKLLESWSMPDVPWPGSHQTVNQAGFSFFEDHFETTWMASLRVITPLSDVGAASFSYPGGQSGMPAHPHSQDLFEPFVAGEQIPLWFHDEDVVANAVETLRLVPPLGAD